MALPLLLPARHGALRRPHGVRPPGRPAAPDATAGDSCGECCHVRASHRPSCDECDACAEFEDATAGDGLRDVLGRWMFERSETWRDLCSPEDADWDEWVDRNREQWREEADAILAEVPALCDVLAAAARDAERDRLREFAEWVLSLADDPPHRRTVTLEQIVQRAALACDPALDGDQ